MASSDFILLGTRYGYSQSVGTLGFSVGDRRQHVRILGAPGTGKSSLMASMIAQDVVAKRGFAIIDGDGRLARSVLDLIPGSPLADKVALFAPADLEHPIGLNIFDRSTSDATVTAQKVSTTIGLFKRLWPDAFFARSEDILGNTVQALCDVPGATFLSIPHMLNDDAYRAQVVEKITDPVIRDFWSVEYAKRSDRFNVEADAPVLNKVRRFLATPLIRNIVGQRRSRIDFRFLVDDNRILVADLGQEQAGEGEMSLFGTLLLTSFIDPTFARLALPPEERSKLAPFTIYIDGFQHFPTDALSRIFSLCGQANIALVIAYQYAHQMPLSVHAALETAGTTIVFRAGGDDAERLSDLFEGDFSAGTLTSLSNGEFCARVLQHGEPSVPIRGYVPQYSLLSYGRGQAITANSRQRLAYPRARVEQWILEFFQHTERDEEVADELRDELRRMKREVRELRKEGARKEDVITALKDVAIGQRSSAFSGGESQTTRVERDQQASEKRSDEVAADANLKTFKQAAAGHYRRYGE